MSLTPNEAADALRDIESTGRRSGQAFGYRISSRFMIIWGVFWIVCYGATDLAPQWTGIVWPVGILTATAASLVAGRAVKPGRRLDGLRYFALVAITWIFLVATYVVVGPLNPRQQGAYVPLLLAAIYSGLGLWIGLRYVVVGVAVAALTLFGFFQIHEHFNLWMAAVGGGGLVLAGLWLRSA